MSEHPHITGFYVVLAAIIGVAGGWFLRSSTESSRTNELHENGTPASTTVGSPERPKETEKKAASEAVDAGSVLRNAEVKQEDAEPTYIEMSAYFDLLENNGVPQLDIVKQYIGKRVKWTGFFYSMDVTTHSKERRYRVLLNARLPNSGGYLYFYLPVEAEPELAKMRKGSKVTVTGVLSNLTELSDPNIEEIEN